MQLHGNACLRIQRPFRAVDTSASIRRVANVKSAPPAIKRAYLSIAAPDSAAIHPYRLPAPVRRSEPKEQIMSDKSPSSSFTYSVANLKPVDTNKVTVTFPDGAKREFPKGTTGLDIAKGISPSLAKRTVAMALDGEVLDLADPIVHDAKIEFINRDDPRALELIRHDAAHVLAEAVQTLWPGTQVTIGPVIENGFYYDFFRNEPFTPEDFAAIEKKMREIIARDKPFTKEIWTREQVKNVFRDKGELFKVELVDAITDDQT